MFNFRIDYVCNGKFGYKVVRVATVLDAFDVADDMAKRYTNFELYGIEKL